LSRLEKLNLLQNLVDLDGYHLGEPWRLSEKGLLVVVPVLKNPPFGERAYVTLEEAKKDLELMDSGSIGEVRARNNGKDPIFVRVGSIFEGKGTQSRAAESSTVIQPTMGMEPIMVRCVHRSQGITPNATFNMVSSASPGMVEYSLLAHSGQAQTWASVGHSSSHLARFSSRTSSHSHSSPQAFSQASQVQAYAAHVGPGDSLVSLMSQTREGIDAIVSKIPVDHVGQTGVCVVDLDGVREFESFDHPKSWEAVAKSIARKYAPELDSARSMVFDLNKDSLNKAIHEFLRSLAINPVNVGGKNFDVRRLSSENAVGEYTEIYDRGVHLIATRKQAEAQESSNFLNLSRPAVYTPQSYSPPPSSTGTARWTTTTGTSTWGQDRFRRRRDHLVLSRTLDTPGGASWSEATRRFQQSTGRSPNPATISETLKAGITEGYIARKGNGRGVYSLTAKGKRLVATDELKETLTEMTSD